MSILSLCLWLTQSELCNHLLRLGTSNIACHADSAPCPLLEAPGDMEEFILYMHQTSVARSEGDTLCVSPTAP